MKSKNTILTRLADALSKGEILLPKLKNFLYQAHIKDKLNDPKWVIRDANLTIRTFKERRTEYNHRTQLEGEFFHPSQLGRCLREVYYKVIGAPLNPGEEKDSAEIFREYFTFEQGTYIGVVMQNLAERAGYLVKREVPIMDKELRIIGHADGLLCIANLDYIWEIKTINSHAFRKLTEPKPNHCMQTHAYMKALGVPRTIFTYFEKDVAQVKEFVIKFDEAFYQREVESRIDVFFKAIRKKSPPAREGLIINKPPCSYCEYNRYCYLNNPNKQLFT